MPCYDSRSDEVHRQNYKLVAILCAVVRKHGERVLEGIDYTGAGVSRDFVYKWWEDHKKEDAARERRNKEYEVQKKTKENALLKLNDRELAALGIGRPKKK